MSTLSMPKINISFTSAAASFVSRGERGVVLMIVRDSSLGGNSYTLLSAAEAPSGLSEANQTQIKNCFAGYVNPPKKVLVYVVDGEDATLSDALAWAATQDFDWLVGPADVSSTECGTIATWIASQRAANRTVRAVLPNHAGNSEAIVNFVGAGMTDGTSTFTAAQYCSRIAGLLAGTPARISATYAPLSELTDCTRMTADNMDTAVGAGQLIVWYDGSQVRLGRAVTSLTTTTASKGDAYKKIKIVAAMDRTARDLRELILDAYIGKFANSYDNKLVLVTSVRDYFRSLEVDGVVRSGWAVDIDVDAQRAWLEDAGTSTADMSEQEIRETDTGSEVFVVASVKYLDAIEDVTMRISI